jgi:threonine aldolase
MECKDEQNTGYGEDYHSDYAKKYIKEKLGKDSDIYFLVGGTQANTIVVSSVLKPYEAVIAVESGRINGHETGALEGQGHKIITIKGKNGKIVLDEVKQILDTHMPTHMALAKMIYISLSTEIGTIYSLEELKEIYEFCKCHELYLYLDCARLASGMVTSYITYSNLANYTDVFYIGGTKNGGYLGEAVVFNDKEISKNFDYAQKHNGALMAKGFVTAIPFEVLMQGNQHLEIGKKENECAAYLQNGPKELGYKFLSYSVTYQIFPIIPKDMFPILEERHVVELWKVLDFTKYYAIRFVTSFTTTIENCQEVLDFLK